MVWSASLGSVLLLAAASPSRLPIEPPLGEPEPSAGVARDEPDPAVAAEEPAPAEDPDEDPAEDPGAEPDDADAAQLRISERLYRQSREYAERNKFHEASIAGLRAYQALPREQRYDIPGLTVLVHAISVTLRAHDQFEDPERLAAIQPPVEDFLAHYQGHGPNVVELRRKLGLVRKERFALYERYFGQKQYEEAAREAEGGFRAMPPDVRGQEIGQQFALAASEALRQQWYMDGDIRHLEQAAALLDEHVRSGGDVESTVLIKERRRVDRSLGVAHARGDVPEERDSRDVGVITPRDRAFLIASGTALGGGATLSVLAGLVGRSAFDQTERGSAKVIVPATLMGVLGGVVSGLAIHSMVDAGFIPRRERRIAAAVGLAVGVAGLAAGTAIFTIGRGRDSSVERKEWSGAGFGLAVGIGAPLGVGISALASRRGG